MVVPKTEHSLEQTKGMLLIGAGTRNGKNEYETNANKGTGSRRSKAQKPTTIGDELKRGSRGSK